MRPDTEGPTSPAMSDAMGDARVFLIIRSRDNAGSRASAPL